MQKSFSKLLRCLSVAIAGVAPALVMLLLGPSTLRARTVSDNFDGGNDSNWTHYGLPAPYAPTYSFTNDGSGGKAYKIYAPPTAPNTSVYGPGRAGSYRQDEAYDNRLLAKVDLLEWRANWNQYGGLLVKGHTIGPGTTAGYSAVYSSVDKSIYFVSITNELTTTIGQLEGGAVPLDPTNSYRLLVSTHDGSTYLFTVFDRSQTNNPLGSVISSNYTYHGAAGYCGLVVLDGDSPSTNGADGTFDNYLSTVPEAGTMPAAVTDLSPPPAGRATAIYPAVTVGILNRDTSVVTNSIVLCMDGTWIANTNLTIDPQVHKPSNPSGAMKDFAGATVSYPTGTLYPLGSKHTNIVAFMDNTSTWQTNTWAWTTAYSYLFASNSLPTNSVRDARGFYTRTVQSSAANIGGSGGLPNSVASAQAVLSNQYPADLARSNILAQLVAWDIDPNNFHNGARANFPGLCLPPANSNSFAVQTLTYLHLVAGAHRFYVYSDDAVGVYSGTNLTDTSTVLLQSDHQISAAFEFVAEADRLYPFNIIYEQGQGDAYLVLYAVALNNTNNQTLVNDTGSGVEAYFPAVCKSSASVMGPYNVVPATVTITAPPVVCGGGVNQSVIAGSVRVQVSGPQQFYRIDYPFAVPITSITQSGADMIITCWPH